MANMNVVFTGTAYNGTAQRVMREDLARAAEAAGYVVQRSVQNSTHLLVASRADTVKANKAKEKGLLVVTYPQFILHLEQKGFPIVGAGRFNPNVDADPLPDIAVHKITNDTL